MKNETGRTLVELISVLAIAGVLAITGIVAYHYAMVKYQANELVHLANLAYVDVISRGSLDKETDLKITDLKGNPLKGFMYNDAGFVIAESVDEDICNRILNDKTNFSILTSKGVDLTLCEDSTGMIFSFSNAKDVGFECRDESDCEDGQYCSTVSGSCVTQTDCQDGQVWDNIKTDSCQYCYNIDVNTPVYSEESCIACNIGETWYHTNKTCITCPTFSSDIKNENQMGDKPCYCDIDFAYNAESDSCEPATCESKMLVYGFNSDNFDVSDNLITYKESEMIIDKKIDLKGCNLTVNGVLSVDENGYLIADDITASGSKTSFVSVANSIGVHNLGIISAKNITANGLDVSSSGSSYSIGVWNKNQMTITNNMTGKSGIVTGTYARSIGIHNDGVLSVSGIATGISNNATGSSSYGHSDGIRNDENGTFSAYELIGASGFAKSTQFRAFSHGVRNNSGNIIIVTTITGTGGGASGPQSAYSDGLVTSRDVVSADTVIVKTAQAMYSYSLYVYNAELKVNTLYYCNKYNTGTITNNGGEYKEIKNC